MRILTAATAALALLLAPVAASALPPVWVVKDHDSTIVMFGSVHLLPPGTDWRPAALKKAMAEADDVWFEAPMDAGGLSAATQAALAHAFLPEGQSLQALLSPAGRKRLAAAAQTVEVPVERLDKLQPWYAELMIQSGLFEKLGVNGSDGVEEQLWAGLSPSAKRVTLETPEQQIGFFADAPVKEQVASLEQTLKDVPHAKRDYQELLEAWLGADTRTLVRQVVAPLKKSSPGLYDRVVTQRNARWIKAIDQRLKGSGETVIVVGMGHLIGPDGLPTRLRAQGYAVEGPR
ncbi:MAG TPA: TraB/GumN family protein [Caulobacteraceae bacterium]